MLIIFLGIFVLVETSMYLVWTAMPGSGGIGYPVVLGVQGRYFIPSVVVGLLIFYYNNKREIKLIQGIQDKVLSFVPIALISMCSLTTFILIIRYWIPNE